MSQSNPVRERRATASAAEVDAFTRWRHYLGWKPGTLRWIKRRANKRERRLARRRIGCWG